MIKIDIAFIGGRGYHSNYGGVENAIREISTRLALKKLRIDVYGVKIQNKNASKNNVSLNNVNSQLIPNWVYNFTGQHGFILYSILYCIFFKRPKIAILFASGPCVFTPILRLGGIKVITSLRAIDSNRDKWGIISKNILRLGEFFSWKFSNYFTVNSLEMVRVFKKYRKDVVYVPNGAKKAISSNNDLLKKYNLQKNEYFLFAARFDPVKRLHLLLQAHQMLEKNGPFKLVVAGGHSKSPDYEKMIKKLANKNVVFTGHISQELLDPLMFSCRAFILPSILEGMSNSLLTAMISSKAVIVADVPENRDVIGDQLDALFTADSICELKQKMQKIIDNKNYALDLGNRLCKVAKEQFNWDKTADIFYLLIKNLMEFK